MIIAEPGQSLIDVAIALGARATHAFYLAINNDLSITDVIASGQKIKETAPTNENFLSFEQLVKINSLVKYEDFITHPNQTLLDIAIQKDGNALALFDWAIHNNLNVTDSIYPGQKIAAIESEERRSKTANYFKGKNIIIATKLTKPMPYLDYLFPGEFPYSF